MKKILLPALITAAVLCISFANKSQEVPVYLQSEKSFEERIEDLLSRMTLEEKVAQMCQYVGLQHIRDAEKDLTEEDLKTNTARGFYPGFRASDIAKLAELGLVGSFLHVVDPKEANELQRLAQKSRLKIPLLIGIDAIHGNAQVKGCTVYPTNIGLASTFEPDLVERISKETALETRATGSHWTFNPNVEVARDPRWGRVGETFGEDPYLVSLMGVAAVKGYQGKDFTGTDKILACAKHFIAGSQSVNGTNGAPADLSERTIREVFFPPFEAAVKAGAFTLMMAHNEVNGIPCHSNEWLMNDVLRKDWGFSGFVVSDWMDIEHMHDLHHTALDNKDAFLQSINAGMDMHMHGPEFYYKTIELVKEGKIPVERIEQSCRKILEAKFKLGLFENPFIDESKISSVIFKKSHQQTALEASRKSIVLLKNNGILPLDASKYKKVVVTGPNANSQAIMGDWALPQPDENIITVLEGLKMVSPQTDFRFVDQGWNILQMDSAKIKMAADEAKKADLAIVVVGEYALRNNWAAKTDGEDTDRSDIALAGLQQQLVEEIYKTGTPTIVVLTNGRPLGVQWINEHVPALIEAWEPGGFGGQAIAEVLYGKVNPSGKLPVSIPYHAGHVLHVYNHKPSMYFHKYKIGPSTSLFPFGFGLSYTSFHYSNLQLSSKEISSTSSLTVTVNVTNTGSRAGEETVQLYLRDMYSSVTRPVKELKQFKKILLKPGETKTLSFSLSENDLRFYNKNMKLVSEPGEFSVMVGGNSRDVISVSFYLK